MAMARHGIPPSIRAIGIATPAATASRTRPRVAAPFASSELLRIEWMTYTYMCNTVSLS